MGWIHQHVPEPLDEIRELGSAPSQGQVEGEKVPRRLRGARQEKKIKSKGVLKADGKKSALEWSLE